MCIRDRLITASFGVATFELDDDDARSLMRRADLALYTAKREGRDRVVGIAVPTEPTEPTVPTEPTGPTGTDPLRRAARSGDDLATGNPVGT